MLLDGTHTILGTLGTTATAMVAGVGTLDTEATMETAGVTMVGTTMVTTAIMVTTVIIITIHNLHLVDTMVQELEEAQQAVQVEERQVLDLQKALSLDQCLDLRSKEIHLLQA